MYSKCMGYEQLTPLTPVEIEEIRYGPVDANYPLPEDRLIIAGSDWRRMVASGRIEIPDDPRYHITDHPNRRDVSADKLDPIATVDNPLDPELTEYWRSSGLLIDTAGRPLHPRAAELFPTTGMFTGPGYGYRYGPRAVSNLGARRERGGEAEYAVVTVERKRIIDGIKRTLIWRGLPGGHVDIGEDSLAAAIREGIEEVGVDIRDRALGNLSLREVQARIKCMATDTAHNWMEEYFVFTASEDNPGLEGVELEIGDRDEILAAEWMKFEEIMRREDFFDTHKLEVAANERYLAGAR